MPLRLNVVVYLEDVARCLVRTQRLEYSSLLRDNLPLSS